MARLFCRHNRLTSSCPICSKEVQAGLPAAPARARPGAGTAARRSGATTPRRGGTTGVVTKKLARAADDGYRNGLVPGCKATADARRLAAALTTATQRLEPPGPYARAAEAPDLEEGTWTAFLLVLGADEAPPWAGGEVPDLPGGLGETAAAYRQWAARAGTQTAAIGGDAAWTPERRFARAYERLSLPRLTRHHRIEFLLGLAAAGLYDLRQGSLHIEREDDAASVAAKRLLVSGDRGLLDRRATDLVRACGVPFGALEHGLAVWDAPGALPEPETLPPAIASALDLS